MGREAYLNLLSLGRQCFEPQQQPPPGEGHHSQQESRPAQQQSQFQQQAPLQPQEVTNGQQVDSARRSEQQLERAEATPSHTQQQRDGSSRNSQPPLDSQRAFRKAQNEVLTIVGIHLHKPNGDGSLYDPSQSDRENDMGLILGTLDLVAIYFLTWPLISIRNELQTFRMLEEFSYVQILGIAFGRRWFLEWFAGMPSHVIFQIANIFRDYGQSWLIKRLRKQPLFRDKTTGKPREALLSNLARILSVSLDLLFFPIYRHSVLQSLHLISATPLFPSYRAFFPIPAGLLSLPFLDIVRRAISPSTYIESPFFWYLIQQKIAFKVHIKFLNLFCNLLPRPEKHEEFKASGGYFGGDPYMTASEDEDNDESGQHLQNGIEDGSGGVTQTFTATVQLDGDSASPRARRQTNASDLSMPPGEGEVNEMSGHISEIEVQVTASTAREYAHGDAGQQNASAASTTLDQERHYRSTQLATHPTDVIASHAADAVATSLTIGLESLVMRTTALWHLRNSPGAIPRTNMILLLAQRATSSSRAVVPPRSLGLYGIYRPMETGKNWGTIGRALALEWGVTWGLFEAAYWVTTWIAVKWFGYR